MRVGWHDYGQAITLEHSDGRVVARWVLPRWIANLELWKRFPMNSNFIMYVHPNSFLGRAIERAGGMKTLVFSGNGLSKDSVRRVDDALTQIIEEESRGQKETEA